MSNDKFIYLDNAATTKIDDQVLNAMLPYFSDYYGNSSSIYTFSQKSKKAQDDARESIAKSIGAKSNEIYFTSGGTEADNWALKASAKLLESKGKHIISSKIEHHAILKTLEYLSKEGFEISYLDVDSNGLINPEDVLNNIRPDTILISIMSANNEIGTIEPIKEIGTIAKEHNILFHTDAVQAYCHIPINVDDLNIDMLSASAHKFHGPKGIGFLYIRSGVKIHSFLHGGAQERKRRAGTENVAAIVGMAKAAMIAHSEMEKNDMYISSLRDYLINKILKEISFSHINGSLTKRLSNNINISFDFIDGESLLLMLDNYGICASSGSACSSGSLEPSHVLLAIGLDNEKARSSLRISLSKYNTKDELDIFIEKLKFIIERLRTLSPEYMTYIKK